MCFGSICVFLPRDIHMQCENHGGMARKGDTPEYVNRMQQEVFEVLAQARSLEELQRVEPRAREVRDKYLEELGDATAGELAIRRRVSRLNYSRRCAEASAVQAHMKQGIALSPGMQIAYVVKDAKKWEVDPVRTATEFDASYYGGLLEKAWEEAAFVFKESRMKQINLHEKIEEHAKIRSIKSCPRL
jgi:DNA polymerase I